MQRGSRIAITTEGTLTLVSGRFPEVSPGAGPSLHLGIRACELPGYEQVFDLAVVGDRIAALFEGDSIHNLPFRGLAITNLRLDSPEVTSVTSDFLRVALTDAAVFVANDDEVRMAPGQSIHRRPIDLASTASQLVVLDEFGAQFYDAKGMPQATVRLFAPTAIAVDPIEPGWLVAIDGGIFHLDGPGDVPHLIAPVAEPVTKVRRDRDAVYVRVGDTLQAIRGEHVEVLGSIDDNAWYWDDFDAGPDGLAVFGRVTASSSGPAP